MVKNKIFRPSKIDIEKKTSWVKDAYTNEILDTEQYDLDTNIDDDTAVMLEDKDIIIGEYGNLYRFYTMIGENNNISNGINIARKNLLSLDEDKININSPTFHHTINN